jgi:hypothetical protein
MAITKGMLAESNINMDQARRVVDRYRISNIKTRVEAIAQTLPMDYSSVDTWIDYDAYMYKSYVNMITMDIAEPEFAKMISKLDELDDMMQHPEVAKLLLEAKFIHRLRKGHI